MRGLEIERRSCFLQKDQRKMTLGTEIVVSLELDGEDMIMGSVISSSDTRRTISEVGKRLEFRAQTPNPLRIVKIRYT